MDVTKTLTDGVTVVSATVFTVEFDESDSEDLSGSYRMQFNIVDVSGIPAIWAILPLQNGVRGLIILGLCGLLGSDALETGIEDQKSRI